MTAATPPRKIGARLVDAAFAGPSCLAAGAQHIHHAVDHLAHVDGAVAAAASATWCQRFDMVPPLVCPVLVVYMSNVCIHATLVVLFFVDRTENIVYAPYFALGGWPLGAEVWAPGPWRSAPLNRLFPINRQG